MYFFEQLASVLVVSHQVANHSIGFTTVFQSILQNNKSFMK